MVANLKSSLEQARLMSALFAERANLLSDTQQKLDTLDEKISRIEKGEVVPVAKVAVKAPKAKVIVANGNGEQKRGRGRPKGSKNKNNKVVQAPAVAPVVAPVAPAVEAPAAAPMAPAVAVADGKKRFRNVGPDGRRLSLKELILTICARHRNGIKLDELAKKCWESGYQSTSQGKQFIQNIRTNLHTLMNNGDVVKDDEKKYHKNAEVAAEAEVAAPVA